jgi:hypothetical protein
MLANDLDPSLAFTALLDQGALTGLTSEEGSTLRRDLLRAYYAQDEVRNLWDFTRSWLAARVRTCRHCGRKIIPTRFGTWQDADNPGYEVCDLADDTGPSHEPSEGVTV